MRYGTPTFIIRSMTITWIPFLPQACLVSASWCNESTTRILLSWLAPSMLGGNCHSCDQYYVVKQLHLHLLSRGSLHVPLVMFNHYKNDILQPLSQSINHFESNMLSSVMYQLKHWTVKIDSNILYALLINITISAITIHIHIYVTCGHSFIIYLIVLHVAHFLNTFWLYYHQKMFWHSVSSLSLQQNHFFFSNNNNNCQNRHSF